MLNNLLQMYLKLLQKKPAEVAGDIIGNKIADRAAKVSKTLP